MAYLHTVTVAADEDLFSALQRWKATKPDDALNVFSYIHEPREQRSKEVVDTE